MAEEFPFTTLRNCSDITFCPVLSASKQIPDKAIYKAREKSFLPSSSLRTREGGNEWAYQTPKHEEED
jgi:hypothetical protein